MGCPLSKNHRKGLCELEYVFLLLFFIAFLIVSSIIAIAFHPSLQPRAILSSLHITMSVDPTHMHVITLAGVIMYC